MMLAPVPVYSFGPSTPSDGHLMDEEPPCRDGTCACCRVSGNERRLFVCRDCFTAGRHKLPGVFECRFCSETCWQMSMMKTHRFLHQKLSEEQMDAIQH
ncbi:unnamed protein product, partial [Mesorhabditis belari]|uniref:C2H2-type domain-containing protein n=1 Tax=Mesorhabditis belari TaxID=2138241 RepID=A0AAF3EU40_9BILA